MGCCKPALWALLALCCASSAFARSLARRQLVQDGPVCGMDGKNYASYKAAAAKLVLTAYYGECLPECSGCVGSSWDPVCMTGSEIEDLTLANKCYATCAADGVSFDSGSCKADSCACIKTYKPVCGASGITYSNACELKCAEDILAKQGPCDASSGSPVTTSGDDDNLDTPVAPIIITAPGLPHGSGSGGHTGSGSGSGELPLPPVPPPCLCPELYAPVCGADGIEYPSACKAACANVTVQLDAPCACLTCAVVTPTPKTQVCGVNNVTYDTTCAATCRGVEIDYKGPCGAPCPAGPAVCGIDGVTYKSECHAARAEVQVGLHQACPAIPPACAGEVANITDPVCVLAPGAYFGKTYKNGCFAKADGADLSKGYTYYRGECMATCDVKCNMNNGTLFQTFSPPTSVSCCGNGLEYPNQCYAQCVGGWTKAQLKSQCERTFCKQGRALRALANVGNCPPGAPVFKCKKYGCVLQRTCPADKGAKCVYAAPCTKFFRLDYLDQPCGGNWIASAGVKSGALSKQCFKAGLLDDTAVIAGAQCVAAGGVCTPDSVTKQPVGGWKLCCSGSCQVTKAGSGVGKCVSA